MGSEAHLQQLYDAYLNAVIQGKAEPPEQFLRAAGVTEATLRERLEQLYQLRPDVVNTGDASSVGNGVDHAGPSSRLGEFILRERLGEGGMGVVYLAEQPSVGRVVALKVIRPEFARSASAAARFEREARAIARLRHPNIVTVHAVGEDRGIRYLAMEYVEGATLSELLLNVQASKRPSVEIEQGQRAGSHGGGVLRASSAGSAPGARSRLGITSLTTVIRWIAELARALQYAHEHDIVHRDVKPSNIRITPDGRPLLLDFGLARDLSSNAATLTEAFIGSPQYVAPEQIGRGRSSADGRADVYSLGVVLYECITGAAPFNGDSLEQVLHSILTVDPPPPRAVNRAIPRDLSVIVMKAIEKDPKQRYASAAELADDLEALMEFRPIRARPPGPMQRGWKWCRRHPAWSTGGAAVALAAIALAAMLFAQQATSQRQRREEADRALAQAAALVEAYRDSRERTEQLENQYEILRRQRSARYFTPDEDRIFANAEDEVLRARNQREQMYYDVHNLLQHAERAGAAERDSQLILAELYLARYLDAVIENDLVEQAIYLELVRRHDADGRFDDVLTGSARVQIASEPPGADVYLFRLAELPERRVAPLPWQGSVFAQDVASNWALRVVRGEGRLQSGDHIIQLAGHSIRGLILVNDCPASGEVHRFDRLVAVDGIPVQDEYEAEWLGEQSGGREERGPREFTFERDGAVFSFHAEALSSAGITVAGPRRIAERGDVPARVWRDGEAVEMILPAGLSVRVTAAPVLIGRDAFFGQTPVNSVRLESGSYLVVLRREGYEDTRFPLRIDRGEPASLRLQLLPHGTTLEGWIHVAFNVADFPAAVPFQFDFWIMEREVKMSEYFEFLNDPETLAEIDAHSDRLGPGARAMRVPLVSGIAPPRRDPVTRRYLLPDDWSWEWPAFGMTWHDAQAYAAWKTKQARAARRAVRYDLPTMDHWTLAVGKSDFRYVFGNTFHPKWVSSCFTRPGPPIPGAVGPRPEATMSFPIDESMLGVFDTAGSVSEWLDAWWIEDRGMRHYAGGSWAHAAPEEMFAIYGGNGARPDLSSGTIGFRLVMRHTGTTDE